MELKITLEELADAVTNDQSTSYSDADTLAKPDEGGDAAVQYLSTLLFTDYFAA